MKDARCAVCNLHTPSLKRESLLTVISVIIFATLVASTRLKRKKKIETNLEGAVGIAFV